MVIVVSFGDSFVFFGVVGILFGVILVVLG